MDHAGESYNILIVILSVATAVIASYVSQDMTSRARETVIRRHRTLWLSGSAVTMGLGIWSMHFLGMLAMQMPFAVTYHLIITFVSLLIAICSSFLAIFLVSRSQLSPYRFIFAGMCMGGGISLMHYIGMAAIQSDYTIHYKLLPFLLSIWIAIIVSYWALYMTFRLQKKDRFEHSGAVNFSGAILLGIAVSGMHYVGMKATVFVASSSIESASGALKLTTLSVEPKVLAYWVSITVFLLVAFLIAGAFIDRRLALQSAQIQHVYYDALFDGNPDLVCTFDLEGRFTHMNPAAEQITGYSSKELLQCSRSLFLATPDIAADAEIWFEQAKTSVRQNIEMELIHKKGSKVSLNVTTIPIVIGKRAVAVMAIAKDVTAYKQKEEIFRRSDKLSIAGQLAAGVAHEIRNPLTSVKGFFQLVRKGLGREDIYDVIDSEIGQIDTIIKEFLLLANHQPIQYKRTSMAELLRHVLTLVQAQAHLNNIKIENRFEPNVPDIVCDENKMKQVFVNLIKNAIESMSNPGTVKLELNRKGESDVLIRIEDEGGGMSDEFMAKLGEPYYSTKQKGTGLGLMVCFKIINEHRGGIDYKRANGNGTVVEVTLPIH